MACKLCLKPDTNLLQLDSEAGIHENIAFILQKYFDFCFTDDTKGGYICTDCWVRVDTFNVFCLHIQTIHQTFYSENQNVASQGWIESDDCKVNATLSIKTEVDDELHPDVFVAPIDEVPIPIPSFQAIQTNDISSIQGTRKSIRQQASKSPVKRAVKSPVKKPAEKPAEKLAKKPAEKLASKPVEKLVKKLAQKTVKKSVVKSVKKPNRSKEINIQCTICGHRFLCSSELLRHTKTVHEVYQYKCQQKCCVDSFRSVEQLKDHVQKAHPKAQCPECKTFVLKKCLKTHIRLVHMKEESMMCDLCGKVLSSRASLAAHHVYEHTVSEGVQCDMCGRWYKNLVRIRAHMLNWHIQKRAPVTCELCGKVFADKNCLKSHRRTHTEDHYKSANRVKCPICGKDFGNNYALRRHVTIHPGMDMDESDSLNSTASKTQIDNSKPLPNECKCEICGRTFSRKQKLKEHLYIHTGITDAYKCDFCDKPFRFQSSLCLHRKKKHPKEEEIRKASQRFRNLIFN